METPQSLGESRVRVAFNVTGNDNVGTIKKTDSRANKHLRDTKGRWFLREEEAFLTCPDLIRGGSNVGC